MSSIISSIGSVVTAAIGWMTDVAEAVAADDLLLLFCTISLVGLGIGFFKRIIN